MGKTPNGQSAPYCPKCEKSTLPLKAKFGTPCPSCGTSTVWYHAYEMGKTRRLLELQREESVKKISEIRQRIDGLTEIPANEQCIGHLQAAVQEILGDLLDRVVEISPDLN